MARHAYLCFGVLLLACCVVSETSFKRVKRQEEDGGDEVNAEQLCDGRPADEYFRLTTEGDCRDVVRCTRSGLKQITCPSGLAFDLDKQTCDWKGKVTNCDKIESKCDKKLFANSEQTSLGEEAASHCRFGIMHEAPNKGKCPKQDECTITR